MSDADRPRSQPGLAEVERAGIGARLFRWEDIDQSLVGLKLIDLAEDLHSKIYADERRIKFENRKNLSPYAISALVLQMKEQRTDEWVSQAYEIYCEVWEKQGHTKSAGFVRTVYARGIVPIIRVRTSTILDEFRSSARRQNFVSRLMVASENGCRLRMNRLESRWRRKLEAEAKVSEHAERIRNAAKIATASALAIEHAGPMLRGNQTKNDERTYGYIIVPDTHQIVSAGIQCCLYARLVEFRFELRFGELTRLVLDGDLAGQQELMGGISGPDNKSINPLIGIVISRRKIEIVEGHTMIRSLNCQQRVHDFAECETVSLATNPLSCATVAPITLPRVYY